MAARRLDMEGKVDLILQTVVTMGEQVQEIKETMVTKNALEETEERIMAELRPTQRAVDKDAKTLLNIQTKLAALQKKF